MAPLRDEVLGCVFGALRRHVPPNFKFVALEDLSNWNATEWGWSERSRDRGYEIAFYETTARHREVSRWVQPLVNSLDAGEVILACRERNGVLEMLVRVATETGLATGAAVLPTFVRYPGESKQPPNWLVAPPSSTWIETIESDEGGRFYIDTSRYALVRVDDASIPDDFVGAWVTVSELKALLLTSNTCTIQLRGVASLLLGADDA
jgi:oxidase EvaA